MKRYAVVATVAVVQLALTGWAVAPQLSARLTGEEHLLRVQPVDPIDPFRGAYVQLDYPDLRPDDETWDSEVARLQDEGSGDVYVSLVERDGVLVATDWNRERPDGLHLRCRADAWSLHCGIESWFVPQDEARAIERTLATDGALAEVRIDSRGNAAIVGLRTD